MAVLTIVTVNKSQLKLGGSVVLTPARVVAPELIVEDVCQQFIADLFETMYNTPLGVGLAANQVGVLLRIAVIDTDRPRKPVVFINPQIVERSEAMELQKEDCLSVPGYTAKVPRSFSIKVEALNHRGEPFSMEAEGFVARLLQHEFDHLDGIVYPLRLDSVDSLGTSLLPAARLATRALTTLYKDKPE